MVLFFFGFLAPPQCLEAFAVHHELSISPVSLTAGASS